MNIYEKFGFEPKYHYDMIQGSDKWFDHKMGVISASKVKCLFVRPKDGSKWGKGALTYLESLATDYLVREKIHIEAKALAWGNKYEDEARILYEKVTQTKVTEVGFIDAFELIGSSPDGLVGDNGVIEIKCPFKEEIFYKYATDVSNFKIPKEHTPQCFMNVFLSKREWCDFIAYNPRAEGSKRIKIVRATLEEMVDFTTPDIFYETIISFRDDLKKRIMELIEIRKQAEEKIIEEFSDSEF